MAIRVSSSRQIDTLVADLRGGDAVKRDAAIARLSVIGARAIDRPLELAASTAPPAARAAAFRALEGIGDPRALGAALAALDDQERSVAQAAVAVARLFLRAARGARVVDALTMLALDRRRDDMVRAAAVQALGDLEPKTIAPLMKSLADDPSATVREVVRGSRGSPASRGSQGSVGSQGSPGSPGSRGSQEVREWIAREGGNAPLTSVLALIERIREREGHEPADRRAEWTNARMAAHLALARRGSRVALFDLKESLAQAAPLPSDALTALALSGDRSCLEPIASAYARAKDKPWRDGLLEAFHAIVKREKLTSRHALIKRIEKRWELVGKAGRAE